jgi:hypothetical protein
MTGMRRGFCIPEFRARFCPARIQSLVLVLRQALRKRLQATRRGEQALGKLSEHPPLHRFAESTMLDTTFQLKLAGPGAQ